MSVITSGKFMFQWKDRTMAM